jgi:hypothetical protein
MKSAAMTVVFLKTKDLLYPDHICCRVSLFRSPESGKLFTLLGIPNTPNKLDVSLLPSS